MKAKKILDVLFSAMFKIYIFISIYLLPVGLVNIFTKIDFRNLRNSMGYLMVVIELAYCITCYNLADKIVDKCLEKEV